jgi:PTS system nitrogen regulatory IIA component
MSLATILRDEDVVLHWHARTKDELLEAAAERLERVTGMASSALLEALRERERLGSTAVGRGIAVPHAGIDDLASSAAALYRLAAPIPFESTDQAPVDVVFVVVCPANQRSGLLALLGEVCRALRADQLLQQVRAASSGVELKQSLAGAIEKSTRPGH